MISGIVPLSNTIGAAFTHHILTWEPRDTKQLALAGFKKFLSKLLTERDVQDLVLAVRPLAADRTEPAHVENTECSEAEDSEEEDQKKAETDYNAFAIPQTIRISDWCRDLVDRVEQIVNSEENMDEFTHCLKTLQNDFPMYKAQVNGLLSSCQQHSPATLRVHLKSERMHLIDFLYEAGKCFNASRHKIRRYIISCEWAALKQDKEELISGIFSPERHADILEALAQHKFYNSDESLEHLRDTLPPAIFRKTKRSAPKEQAGYISAKQKRKRIAEKLKGAQQIVQWSKESRSCEAYWTTSQELAAKHGERKALKLWRHYCFSGALKAIEEFEKPVTQAQAMAHWRNQKWSWEDCNWYWNTWPELNEPHLAVDVQSHKRMRRNLQEILGLFTV